MPYTFLGLLRWPWCSSTISQTPYGWMYGMWVNETPCFHFLHVFAVGQNPDKINTRPNTFLFTCDRANIKSHMYEIYCFLRFGPCTSTNSHAMVSEARESHYRRKPTLELSNGNSALTCQAAARKATQRLPRH